MPLSKIQNLPIQTRIKILWTIVIVIAVGLAGIWVFSSTKQIKTISKNDLPGMQPPPPPPSSNSISAEPEYTAVEWIERKDNKMLVYFKLQNPTANIMNFSKANQITLTINGQTQNPSLITDRQGNPFVAKALSQSQSFGIAEFEDRAGDKAQLKFDNLFFENDPTKIFNETFDLNLDKLIKPN